MAKIVAQDIKDLGFKAELYVKKADSEVIGTDGRNYVCINDHIAADDNKPVTGASWQTYWVQSGSDGLAWVTATNYKASFKTFIDLVIAEQAPLLEGRIGSTVYASATTPTSTYVARAEKCRVAAEMVQRRINIILGNAVGSGQEIDISHEAAQKRAYLDEAEMWIAKLAIGVTSDSGEFACGSLITSHFEDDNA